jgi:hypothetical protein
MFFARGAHCSNTVPTIDVSAIRENTTTANFTEAKRSHTLSMIVLFFPLSINTCLLNIVVYNKI